MKRLLVTTLALCITVAVMNGEDVKSGNVIGYNLVTLTKTYTLLALNFSNVGFDSNAPMSIQDVVPGNQTGLNNGANQEKADNILLSEGANKTVTYYLSNGMHGNKYTPEMSNKWVRVGEKVPSAAKLNTGTAFWYVSRTATGTPVNLTFTGQVTVKKSDQLKPDFSNIQ